MIVKTNVLTTVKALIKYPDSIFQVSTNYFFYGILATGCHRSHVTLSVSTLHFSNNYDIRKQSKISTKICVDEEPNYFLVKPYKLMDIHFQTENTQLILHTL